MEDVHGIWMASDHPSRIWFMSFRADHIPQTHQWLIAPRRSFSFGAVELFTAQGETGERRREFSGCLEPGCQVDRRSCKCGIDAPHIVFKCVIFLRIVIITVVVTTSFYLHIFKVQFAEKRIQIGEKQPSGLSLVTISLLLNGQVPF
ncbi:hypothetical protein ACSBR2_004939 [Camellia fascicularis]